ncbi:MAG TPA: hypothetical protein VJU61_04040, partial [Polyangiaceae bacterium]|nr:hypothetical protein [Polyangiaceae bacterium]
PSHYDLQRAAPGFEPFVTGFLAHLASFEGVPSAALLEAASIDAAMSRVFLAPETRPLKPAALVAAELPQRRLRQAENVALVREHWPLIALRRSAQAQASTTRLALPPRLEAPQHWLIMRKGQGHLYVQLPVLAYRLYALLAEQPVGDALGRLEQECSDAERRTLPALVQSWLRQGMEHELWVEPA